MTGEVFSLDLGQPLALSKLAQRLAEKAQALQSPPLAAEQVEQILARLDLQQWQDGRQERRDLRRLPWLLSLGQPPLHQRASLPALLERLPHPLSGNKLKGLIYSCLMISPETPAPALEGLVERVLQSLEQEQTKAHLANRQPGPLIQHWLRWRSVFHPKAYPQVAVQILEGSLSDWQERLRLPSNSPRVSPLLRSLAKLTCSTASERIEELLKSTQEVSQQALLLDTILLTKLSLGQEQPDQALISYALRYLGDPRQDRQARWHNVTSSARNLVSRWLSEEDLRIFFSHLGGDHQSERRKAYWSKFVAGGRINYSRIFFSPRDKERLPQEIRVQVQRANRHGHFESSAQSCSSAFILGIDDFYIVEFNLTGNASRLFRRQDLPLELLNKKSYPTHEFIKRNDYLEHLTHRAQDWESHFDETLSRHFPVPRGRSR